MEPTPPSFAIRLFLDSLFAYLFLLSYLPYGVAHLNVGRQKAAANAQDEERMLIKLLVVQHLANKRIEQSQKERSSSWALDGDSLRTLFFELTNEQ